MKNQQKNQDWTRYNMYAYVEDDDLNKHYVAKLIFTVIYE